MLVGSLPSNVGNYEKVHIVVGEREEKRTEQG